MVRSFGPVIATALMAVGAVIVFVDHSLIQVAVGGALVLWLPGYALTAALFSQSQLQGIERTLFSIGTSIAVAILTGFGLNAVGISLTGWTWGVALGGLALAAGALAWLQPTHRPVRPRLGAWVLPQRRNLLLFGAAALLVVAAIGLARFGATEQPQQGFTNLWMLPAPDGVRIGLDNEESTAMTYRVVLTDGTSAIAEWPTVRLESGQQWDGAAAVPANVRTGVEVLVYRADAPGEIYRRVGSGPVATPGR